MLLGDYSQLEQQLKGADDNIMSRNLGIFLIYGHYIVRMSCSMKSLMNYEWDI